MFKSTKMNNLSEQKIIVHCDFSESMKTSLLHGLQIARIFKKELCLFHPLGFGDKSKKETQIKLGQIIRKIKEENVEIPISSLTLKGDLRDTIDRVAEQYDGIMVILSPDPLEKKLEALQESQIPFLFVRGTNIESLKYSKVLLPVDYRKAMKNTALWASYFGRFNGASAEILYAKEKNKENSDIICKNLKFIDELLGKVNMKKNLYEAGTGSFGLPFEALAKCRQENANLLIIPASRNISLLDLAFGLPESRILKKSGSLPVLCINPNRDMYILCD